MSKNLEQVKSIMKAQHAVHGMMADVFERIGGEEGLVEFIQEGNQKWFYTLFLKNTPTLLPQAGVTGDVNITVNQNLQPTDLDSVTLDEQGRVVQP